MTPMSIWTKVLSKLSMANKSLWLNATWDHVIEFVWHTQTVTCMSFSQKQESERMVSSKTVMFVAHPNVASENLRPREPSALHLGFPQQGVFLKERKRCPEKINLTWKKRDCLAISARKDLHLVLASVVCYEADCVALAATSKDVAKQ